MSCIKCITPTSMKAKSTTHKNNKIIITLRKLPRREFPYIGIALINSPSLNVLPIYQYSGEWDKNSEARSSKDASQNVHPRNHGAELFFLKAIRVLYSFPALSNPRDQSGYPHIEAAIKNLIPLNDCSERHLALTVHKVAPLQRRTIDTNILS